MHARPYTISLQQCPDELARAVTVPRAHRIFSTPPTSWSSTSRSAASTTAPVRLIHPVSGYIRSLTTFDAFGSAESRTTPPLHFLARFPEPAAEFEYALDGQQTIPEFETIPRGLRRHKTSKATGGRLPLPPLSPTTSQGSVRLAKLASQTHHRLFHTRLQSRGRLWSRGRLLAGSIYDQAETA